MCLEILCNFPVKTNAEGLVVAYKTVHIKGGKPHPCFSLNINGKPFRNGWNRDRREKPKNLPYEYEYNKIYPRGYHFWATIKAAKYSKGLVSMGRMVIECLINPDDIVAQGIQWNSQVIVAKAFKNNGEVK